MRLRRDGMGMEIKFPFGNPKVQTLGSCQNRGVKYLWRYKLRASEEGLSWRYKLGSHQHLNTTWCLRIAWNHTHSSTVQNFIKACSVDYVHQNLQGTCWTHRYLGLQSTKMNLWGRGSGVYMFSNQPRESGGHLTCMKHWSKERVEVGRDPATQKCVRLHIKNESQHRR